MGRVVSLLNSERCAQALQQATRKQAPKHPSLNLTMQKKLRLRFKLLIGGTTVVVLAAAVAIAANMLKTPKPRQIDGQVEVLQYSVQVQQRGKVLEIRVKEGDYVEVGDTLALYRTDDTPMPEDATLELLATTLHPYRTGNRNVDRAYGRWQQAKSAEEQAERIYNDVQQKFMNGKAPASLRDNVFTEYKTLQVQALSLKADYEKALHNLKTEKSNSKGPQIIAIVTKVEGEVSEIVVKRGEQLSANNTLMSIALLDNLWGSIAVTRNRRRNLKRATPYKCIVSLSTCPFPCAYPVSKPTSTS